MMKILSIVGYPTQKIIKTKSNSLKKLTENLKVTEKSVTANLKSYYQTAKEKLNDIYFERESQGASTYIVEKNLKAFDSLPESMQKAIDPREINYMGSINQSYINGLWNAGKISGKSGYIGYAPTFRGNDEVEELLTTTSFDEIPEFESKELDTGLMSIVDGSNDLADNIEATTDIAADISEHSSDIIENLTDLLG